MAGKATILERIRNEMMNGSANTRQIGQVILDQPQQVTRMSIGRLAQLTNVSDPSIIRFCRSLGFSGFKEFKFALAEETTITTHYLHLGLSGVGVDDSYIYKTASSSLFMLTDMVSNLKESSIEAAVEVLSNAARVEFWGQGASAIVAADAQYKFFRVGIPCASASDPHTQAMSASVMGPKDVLVVISHTGFTQELIYGAKIARANGAAVVGITTEHSPLAEQCTHLVAVNLNEDTDVVLPMVSRLAHLLAIDILTVGVMRRLGPKAEERISLTKEALNSIKYLPDGDE